MGESRNGRATVEMKEVETSCGFFSCRPRWLQTFNNPKFVCFCLGMFGLVQGFAVNGVNNVNTVAYERRFQISSAFVGWISSAFSVSAGIFGVFISFYGSRRNKSKFLAGSFFISALGAMCMFLPHFITDQYEWGQTINNTCNIHGKVETCNPEGKANNAGYAYFLILGQALMGIGSTAFLTVGMAFIDDSVHADSTPVYIAITQIFYILGPTLGVIIGGRLLDLYVDIDTVPRDQWTLQPEDPRWVGAWWIGFVVACGLIVLSAVPFCFYGAELPTAKEVREMRQSQIQINNTMPLASSLGQRLTFREFYSMAWSLLKNPVFMCVTIAYVCAGVLLLSIGTFGAKIVQNQFNRTASNASTLLGAVFLPATILGLLGSGIFMKRKSLTLSGTLKLLVGVSVLALFTEFGLLLNCGQSELAGFSVQYPNRSDPILNLYSDCNAPCNCDTDPYEPVCDVTGNRFYSPCLAGCMETSGNGKTYTNCTCIPDDQRNGTVSFSQCPEKRCPQLIPFLILTGFTAFFSAATIVPVLTAVLRCCREHERTFAMGILGLFVRIIGNVPGPILLGAVIDAACSKWGEICGERTSCWIYDKKNLSRNLTLFALSFALFKAVFFAIALKVHKPALKSSEKYKETINEGGQEATKL